MPSKLAQSMSEEEMFLSRNPIDDLRMYVNAGTPTEAQKVENGKKLLSEILSMTPGPGNVMAVQDAMAGSEDAWNAFSDGNYKQGGLSALMAGLSGVGAVTGLPVGKLAKAMAGSGKNTLNIFAGPIAKTADHTALGQAQEMAQSGVSRDDIWRDTGWFQGVDGKWRFEIDDSNMSVTPPKNKMSGDFSSYSKVVDHPELYASYPPMSRNRVTFDHRDADSGIQLTANPNGLNGKPFDMSIGMKGRQRIDGTVIKPQQVREHTVHELQHNVSARERFAEGGNPQAIFEDIMEGNPNLSPEIATEMAIDQYKRMADEVAARNAATRLNMSAADRRATAPWLTQDVPDDQQIVRFR